VHEANFVEENNGLDQSRTEVETIEAKLLDWRQKIRNIEVSIQEAQTAGRT